MNADRLRPAGLALAAVALAGALTACQGGGGAAGGAAPGAPAPAATTATAAPGAAAGTTAPPAAVTPTVVPAVKKPATPKGPAPTASAPAKAGSRTKDCVDSPPGPDEVDPDEFALYRIEELDGSTGKVNLVVQHGRWGCASKDSDGVPFVGTGEESRWALDQAAYVTATNPIVGSSTNQRIGVQELIDWVKAHPDSGLVFRYETGNDGAIHSLEQVFAP
ncbi:hypothetical protein [Streptomyces sp. NPDC004284]|uniref:hypothetical protein n=1 Tax=Streptomyces sp. NPDC004284 TaxID=3364695 RepID=UPI003694CA1A